MDNSPHGKSLSSAPAEGKPQQALKGLWFGRMAGEGFSSAMNVDTARAHPEISQSAEQPKPMGWTPPLLTGIKVPDWN